MSSAASEEESLEVQRHRRAIVAAVITGDARFLPVVLKWSPFLLDDCYIHHADYVWKRVPGWRGAKHGFEDDKHLDRWRAQERDHRMR